MQKNIKRTKIMQNEKGIGLVETIAALGVAVIVITSLVSLSVFTLRSSTRGKVLLTGSKLANTELELVRAYRDRQTDWTVFINDVASCSEVSSCSMSSSGGTLTVSSSEKVVDAGQPTQTTIGFYATDPINGDGVDITDDVVRISVRVSWQDGSDTKYSYIYTDISNWRF